MANISYFVNSGEQYARRYQQQQVVENQELAWDRLFIPDQLVFPSPDGTDILGDLPILFEDLPYPAEVIPTGLWRTSPDSGYPEPHPEYIQDEPAGFASSWPTVFSDLPPGIGAGEYPYMNNAYQKGPPNGPSGNSSSSRSMDSDTFFTEFEVLSASERSQPKKTKTQLQFSQRVIDTGTQGSLRKGYVREGSHSSSMEFRSPKHPAAKPQEIEPPKSKKLRGLPSSLITVFDANTQPHVRRNVRKSYSDEARKKVEDVRKIGACSQCRFRKRTCGTGWPCHACIRRAESVEMAEAICIRESASEDANLSSNK